MTILKKNSKTPLLLKIDKKYNGKNPRCCKSSILYEASALNDFVSLKMLLLIILIIRAMQEYSQGHQLEGKGTVQSTQYTFTFKKQH